MMLQVALNWSLLTLSDISFGGYSSYAAHHTYHTQGLRVLGLASLVDYTQGMMIMGEGPMRMRPGRPEGICQYVSGGIMHASKGGNILYI